MPCSHRPSARPRIAFVQIFLDANDLLRYSRQTCLFGRKTAVSKAPLWFTPWRGFFVVSVELTIPSFRPPTSVLGYQDPPIHRPSMPSNMAPNKHPSALAPVVPHRPHPRFFADVIHRRSPAWLHASGRLAVLFPWRRMRAVQGSIPGMPLPGEIVAAVLGLSKFAEPANGIAGEACNGRRFQRSGARFREANRSIWKPGFPFLGTRVPKSEPINLHALRSRLRILGSRLPKSRTGFFPFPGMETQPIWKPGFPILGPRDPNRATHLVFFRIHFGPCHFVNLVHKSPPSELRIPTISLVGWVYYGIPPALRRPSNA